MLKPLFVAALAVSTVLGRSPGDAAQACLPQDARGTALLESAKSHVTDPSSTSFRAVTMKVPVVTENDVQFVSDESVCMSALQAYAAAVPAGPGTSFSAVYVIRTGTYYVVAEPTQRAGEWMRAIVVDGTYAKKSGIFGL